MSLSGPGLEVANPGLSTVAGPTSTWLAAFTVSLGGGGVFAFAALADVVRAPLAACTSFAVSSKNLATARAPGEFPPPPAPSCRSPLPASRPSAGLGPGAAWGHSCVVRWSEQKVASHDGHVLMTPPWALAIALCPQKRCRWSSRSCARAWAWHRRGAWAGVQCGQDRGAPEHSISSPSAQSHQSPSRSVQKLSVSPSATAVILSLNTGGAFHAVILPDPLDVALRGPAFAGAV